MSTLEQRLADELGSVAQDLGTPYVDAAGLAAAGRRETVRRRAVTGVLAGAAAAVLAVTLVAVLPGGSGAPAPAGPVTGSAGQLGRPLELPWWAWDDRVLSVDGRAVGRPLPDVTAIRSARGRTLVAQDRTIADRWSVVEDGAEPLSEVPLTGAPVVGDDGSIGYVEDHGDEGYTVMVRSAEGGGYGSSYPAGPAPVVVALLPNDRALLAVDGDLVVHLVTGAGSNPVFGLAPARGVRSFEPRPTGLAVREVGTVAAAEITGNEVRILWETASEGPGAWSEDGEQYAEATDGGVRIATRAGATGITLEQTDLRVVGWESDTEVVVVQWLPEDEAVTGAWRCSAVELRCAAIADAPTGRILLPGL